jgi:RNA polymerase sigma-B factor
MPTSVTVKHPAGELRDAGLSSSEALLRRYHRDGGASDRDELVRRFIPLARSLARRYASPSAPYEDLAQVASLALVKAVDRFDPERGTSFRAYATPTILGEMKRYFRDSVWTVHVTRAAKERALAVDRATEELSTRLGHSPTVREITEYLELEEEDVLDALQVADAYAAASLDEPRSNDGGDEGSLESQLGVEEERYELIEDALAVREAIGSLPPRDALVLRLRFGQELSQREIGARLGVSQMQVSRLLRRALERLRTLAGGDAYTKPAALSGPSPRDPKRGRARRLSSGG